MAKSKSKILFAVSGSIAAYRACGIVSELTKRGHRVICLMTKGGREFITPLTLKTLSNEPVFTDTFEHSSTNLPVHTELADGVNLIVYCPATANLISRLAHGMADDLVTEVTLASNAPKLLVPVMNDTMYQNSFTQENIERLRSAGFKILNPIEGDLACRRKGIGHIPEDGAILKSIEDLL